MQVKQDNEFPESITTEAGLIDFMTRPSSELVSFVSSLPDRVVVLGAGGKMGPTLCIRLARAAERAGRELDIAAVSRFSDKDAQHSLEEYGIRVHRADLLDPDVYADLPDAEVVYYLVGQKFGTTTDPYKTWSTNTIVPTYTCQRYGLSKHNNAGSATPVKVVALSTGNVYGMTEPSSGGSRETDLLHPIGEYAASCVGRERVFEHFAATGDVSAVLVRLNYAIDLRYGVLMDMAQRIVAGEPIELGTGYFNCIWQGDANDIIIRSAGLRNVAPDRSDAIGAINSDQPASDESPRAHALNVTGPAVLSVREVALALSEALDSEAIFSGKETRTALLSNAAMMVREFGAPPVPLERMVAWTADWIKSGGVRWSKPTHFETRDGRF